MQLLLSDLNSCGIMIGINMACAGENDYLGSERRDCHTTKVRYLRVNLLRFDTFYTSLS
jgi:hypothetical protein